MTRLSVSGLRRNAADVLNRVAYGGDRIIVHRRNKDVAVIISLDDYELLKRFEDAKDRKAISKSKATQGRSVDWDTLKPGCNL